MSVFPPEIWHLICPVLEQNDLCSLRLVDKAAASIGAGYLISSIRIDTSLESLQRLKEIADHPGLSKGVRQVTYEAGLLADVCIHFYEGHYKHNEHPGMPMPVEPSGDDATPRAIRLYARAMAKFEAQVEAKYAKYRAAFDEQERNQEHYQDLITSSLAKLKLKNITLETGGSPNADELSEQFRKKYCFSDCAIPLNADPDRATWQLLAVLVPGLTHFTARQVSLDAFSEKHAKSKEWLAERFTGLHSLELEFRQGREADPPPEAFPISDSWLAYAVEAAAQSLTSLSVYFNSSYGLVDAGKLSDLVTTEMPNLRKLDITFFTTTEDSFIGILKTMPKLKDLEIAFIELTTGQWLTTARRMRNELGLQMFIAQGLLKDPVETIATDHCDRRFWASGERSTITEALILYVTEKKVVKSESFNCVEDFETCFNPFLRLTDYEDEEDLLFEYGPIGDDGDDTDTDADEENSDHNEGELDDDEEMSDAGDDNDMPNLTEDATAPMDVD